MKQITRPEMCEIIPEAKKGNAEIKHYTITEEESKWSSLRATINRVPFMAAAPMKTCQLRIGGAIMMSDTDMEWRTNQPFIRRAHGRVLIGGLGIGFVILPLLNNPEVESVTVIENSQDVIDLVAHHIEHPKLTVMLGDVYEFKKHFGKDVRFDCIYFDILPSLCGDNLDEMRKLEAKYRPLLQKNGSHWIGSWSKEELKYMRRIGR